MPTPIVELIRSQYLTAMTGTTTLAADGTTKAITLVSVSKFGDDTTDLLASLEQGAELSVDDADGVVRHHTHIQEFHVGVNIEQPATSAIDLDSRCNFIASDIRKAVMSYLYNTSTTQYHLWTAYLPVTYLVNNHGAISAVIVNFKTCYRTLLDNPYSQ